MKAWVQTTPDFEYEVVDVILGLQVGEDVTATWIKGFDDVDWEQAEQFARDLATLLHCEYIGEVGEANHELDYDILEEGTTFND